MLRRAWICTALALAAAALVATGPAVLGARQSAVDISIVREMAWRSIGPFRGGRATAVAGIPSQPNTFFAGTANGGVWKTTDAGRTWRPIFDQAPTGAIGSIAVAASNPDVLYVGTGEAPLDRRAAGGRGLFRSNDAGRTWSEAGLAGHRHLSAILIDPANPDRIFVASTGSAFVPSRERGVFRSTNGGRSFEQVYFKDQDTGALDLAFDPGDTAVVYATLLQSREPASPGERSAGAGTGLIKSTDGGTTWTEARRGLPTFADDGLRRIRMATARSNRSRLFAVAAARSRSGIYRSDDGGGTWTLAHASSPLVNANDDGATVVVDPVSADVVYVLGRQVARSTDGGRTFTPWRTEPADVTFRAAWINPTQSGVVALGGDRGAVVTVNAGESWSSAYNQPTGQFAEVVTDTAFPYRVCGAERDSPPGCLPSRAAGGRIGPGDWRSVSATVGAAVAPDPQDADIVYSGAVSRFDRRTGQLQNVLTAPAPPTALSTALEPGPLVFSTDGRTVYYGGTTLWRGAGGVTWSVMSPEISRDDSDGRGRISAVAPSPIDGRLIWVGTDDGALQVTRDAGVTWTRATPSFVAPWSRVSSIEPSHFDTNTAYASVVATSIGDDGPHLIRTRNGGVSWQPITTGLPPRATVYAVREDIFRRGLLFATTAESVFVSFDDGEVWQPLRLNLPPVPVTDLVVKDADLVVSTDGRGFWILDDISPLRQITGDLARAGPFLFRPATAWRTHPMQTPDAAAHRDEPAAANPPDGVAINYLAGPGAADGVTIEIIETLTGDLIRRYDVDGTPGLHRVIWDMKYTPVAGRSIWVMPGTYQVRLTAGSLIARQAVIVRMDPRLRVSVADLTAQFKASRAIYERRRRLAAALERAGDTPSDRERAATWRRVAADLDRALDLLQQADTRPAAAAEAAAAAALASADSALGTPE